MAKPKKNVPPADQTGRAERKKLMKDLSKFKKGSNIKGYKEYVAKMTALDALMEHYSVKNAFGVVPTMDEKAKNDMQKAIKETTEAGEEYLKNAMESKNAGQIENLKSGVPGVVNRLQGMLRRDQESLEQYDPKTPLSLPQVLDASRSNVVFLDRADMEKLGGAQSSRIPITFRGRDGKEYKGFFTKESKAEDTLDEYVNKLLEEAAGKCGTPASRDSIRNMLNAYRATDPQRLNNVSDAQIFWMIANECTERTNKWGGSETRLKVNVLEKKLGMSSKVLGLMGLKALGNAFMAYEKYSDQAKNLGKHFNSALLGMEKDARIDNRNTAMSSVAKLLGQPNLVAKSVNMKFMDENGNVQEGTFMDVADGIDLAAGGEKMRLVNENPFEGRNSGKGLKQMADLQVLDYICGNVDRHQGNMFYKVDENGDVVGVQGIDNDSSFGRFANRGENVHALPSPQDMNVISASMAKKVMGLTPAMLKYTLRGRGLSEEEMEFAAQRLTTLQQAIQEGKTYYKDHPTKKTFEAGHLRVLSDKEFNKLKLRDLHVKKQINIFTMVDLKMQSAIDEYKVSPKFAFDPAAQQGKLRLQEVSAAGRGFTGGNLVSALAGASKLVEDKDKKFKIDDLTNRLHGSSPEFDEMTKAAKKIAEMERELLASPIPPTLYNRRRQEIDEAVAELGKKNDAYLTKKMGDRGVQRLGDLTGKNTYEQARIDHARKIKNFVDAYEKPRLLKDEDIDRMNEQDAQEFRIASELGEMRDRQQAFQLLSEFHKKHNMPTPEEMLAQRQKERQEAQDKQPEAEEPVLGGP